MVLAVTNPLTCLATALALATAAAPMSAEEFPAQRLDLSSWKLTLPVDRDSNSSPDEVEPGDLRRFVLPGIFELSSSQPAGVIFRAPCGGVTTRGSKYPRCELRELLGTRDAAWSTSDERPHILHARLQISATPLNKKHVVCAQIHDANDDLLMVRLEGEKLLIERNGDGDVLLERHYKLGAPFDLVIQAGQGRVKVSKDGKEALNWEVVRSGCYFKAGCYTQSNLKSGDAADAFGEVIIHSLRLSRE